MSALILPSRFNQQPQQSVPLAKPWADRVKFLIIPERLSSLGANSATTVVAARTGRAASTAVGQYMLNVANVFPAGTDLTRASVSAFMRVRDTSDGGFSRTILAFAASTSDAGILKSASGAQRLYVDIASYGGSFTTYPLDMTRPRLFTLAGTGGGTPATAAYGGDVLIDGSSTVPVGNGISIGCHGATATNIQSIDEFYYAIACYPALTRAEHNALDAAPWQLWAAPRRLWAVAAGAPANASGTFASTLGNAVLAAAGTVASVGPFATTLASASMAAAGSVGAQPSGSIAATLGNATLAAAGVVLDIGSFATTLSGAVLSASGIVASNASGTLSTTLAGASLSASGFTGAAPPPAPTQYRRRAPHRSIQ